MIHMDNLGVQFSVKMKICSRLLIFELSDCTLRIFRGYDFSIFKVSMKRNFLFFLTKEHKKIGRLPFTVSQYLIWF